MIEAQKEMVPETSVTELAPRYKFPGAWRLFKESIQYLGLEWKYLLKISLWPMVVTVVTLLICGLIMAFLGIGSRAIKLAGTSSLLMLTEGRIWLAALAVVLVLTLFVFLMIVQLWGVTALMVAVVAPDPERRVRATFGKAWPLVGKYWWVMFLAQLAVMGGLLLFLVPGMVLAFSVMMASWVVVDEGIGGTKALLKSRFYMGGRKISIFWRIVVINLAFFVLNLIVGDLTKSRLDSVTVLAVMATIVLSLLQGVLSMVFLHRCYLALKEEKKAGTFNPQEAKVKYIFLEWLGLIAILVVPLSVGLLATLNPRTQVNKAKDMMVKNEVQKVSQAVETYFAVTGELPTNLTELENDYLPPGFETDGYQYYHYGNENYSVCGSLVKGGAYCLPESGEQQRL